MNFSRSKKAGIFGAMVAAGALGACGGSEGSTFNPGDGNGGNGNGVGSGGSPNGGAGSTIGSGGAIIGNPGLDASVGGGTGVDPDAACVAQVADTKPLSNDIFIMLDRSLSMECAASDDGCDRPNPDTPATPPTRWDSVTSAINTFVSAPASTGIGVGIGFFSLGTCDVAKYATPSVAIAPLPSNAQAISNEIAQHKPGSNTPTVPALQGAINYATQYTTNTPGRSAAVVFVTDGLPNGCSSTIDGAAAAAKAAYDGQPQIKTYVIGLGATASLDQIALAGTGGAQHFFPATGDVAGQLQSALKTISSTISCDYQIPTTGQALDYGAVNVQTIVGTGGTPTNVGKIDTAAQCSALGGWYYDTNPAQKTPSKITLCPQSCDPLKAAEGSSLKVLIGCASEPPVPR